MGSVLAPCRTYWRLWSARADARRRRATQRVSMLPFLAWIDLARPPTDRGHFRELTLFLLLLSLSARNRVASSARQTHHQSLRHRSNASQLKDLDRERFLPDVSRGPTVQPVRPRFVRHHLQAFSSWRCRSLDVGCEARLCFPSSKERGGSKGLEPGLVSDAGVPRLRECASFSPLSVGADHLRRQHRGNFEESEHLETR